MISTLVNVTRNSLVINVKQAFRAVEATKQSNQNRSLFDATYRLLCCTADTTLEEYTRSCSSDPGVINMMINSKFLHLGDFRI